ncbi:MAG: sulfite oxidase-like oxidoreductase [Actinomycetota bacterium]|jgi:DMSO/TMAO reductase YedYZ molybdopterin-dependent catalytic subunit
MGFFDRNREQLANKGIDDARLPPGQYLTERFPVLHVGDVPTYAPGDWDLKIFGLVDKPFTVNLDELKSMPAVTLLTDIHCVTKWSKFDTTWKGVRVRDLFERAGMQKDAGYIMGHAEHGYTANLPLADVLLDESLVVYEYEGEEIEPIHGGPVRLLVPHLYFWKSPKWLRGLELRATDAPGFWEQNGYNMYGDPFLEQRFWGD